MSYQTPPAWIVEVRSWGETDLSKFGVLPFGFLDQVGELNIEDLSSHYPGERWESEMSGLSVCGRRYREGGLLGGVSILTRVLCS